MGVATGATGFGTGHAVGSVSVLGDVLLVNRSIETGPTAARFELGFRFEKGRATSHTVVHPALVIIPVFAGKGALGAGFSGYVVLLRGQLLAPFGFGLGDFFGQFFRHISLLP